MIYPRIDTYSVILYNTTIKSILEHLFVPTKEFENVYKSYDKHDVKVGDMFIWTAFGIRIECKLNEYFDNEDNKNIFEVEFAWIRLYLSSTAIDNILAFSKDVEGFDFFTCLCNVEYWYPIATTCRITRCDFAFDYINYEGNEFERLRKLIANADFDEKLSDKGRLFTGDTSGLSYSYRGGKERTIYLGSTTSDRMLRIYDKKYQLTDVNGIFDTEKIPKEIVENEITVDSWYRIELQTRDNFAERYLYSCGGNFRYIMGEIAAFFDVRTREGKLIAPLHKIFLWTERTPIIQNANSVQTNTILNQKGKWIGDIAASSAFVVVAGEGINGLIKRFNDHTFNIVTYGTKQQKEYYLNKQRNDLATLCEQEKLTINDFGNIVDSNGNVNADIYRDDNTGAYYIRFVNSNFSMNPKGPYSQNE